MNRFKVGDRVSFEGAAATIVPSNNVNLHDDDYNYLIKFDVVPHPRAYDWEGYDESSVRYVYDGELTPLEDNALYVVAKKVDVARYVKPQRAPTTPYTYDTAIDAAREFAKDGDEYLVLKAVASVKIPQVLPVVTTL